MAAMTETEQKILYTAIKYLIDTHIRPQINGGIKTGYIDIPSSEIPAYFNLTSESVLGHYPEFYKQNWQLWTDSCNAILNTLRL